MPYKVLVDDNFHYMDEEERYEHGQYQTWEEAVAAAKQIVDSCLVHDFGQYFHEGMTAEQMYDRYTSFGEDPFIRPVGQSESGPHFSAWDYAKQRCMGMVQSCEAEIKKVTP